MQEHQKMMEDFESDRQREVAEMKEKHEQDLIHLKETNQSEAAKVNGNGAVKEVPVADLLSGAFNGNHGDTVNQDEREALEAELFKLRQDESEALRRHEDHLIQMKSEHLQELENVKVTLKVSGIPHITRHKITCFSSQIVTQLKGFATQMGK